MENWAKLFVSEITVSNFLLKERSVGNLRKRFLARLFIMNSMSNFKKCGVGTHTTKLKYGLRLNYKSFLGPKNGDGGKTLQNK